MAAVDDPKTLGRARLSFADVKDIEEFVATLSRFESGEIGPDQWRAFRLVRGTYGQRQPADASMLRVKIPQGILDAAQLEALADVADNWSRGFGHITTRQNMQFHFVKLHDVELAMRRCAEAGLTTREACGNSVRNITGCAYSGVAEDEVFDVTPYAEALTRYLLRHPLSSSLPRKFKIAFEGCAGEDHAFTRINDLGWRAQVRGANGSAVRGFRVTVGGGTAILCTPGHVLFDFLPAGEIFDAAEAVLRVFHRLGDYQHKQRNRLKFLIRSLGWEAWRAEFDRAFAEVRGEGGRPLPFDPEDPPVEAWPEWERTTRPRVAAIGGGAAARVVRGPGIVPERVALPVRDGAFEAWTATNLRPQKQPGFSVVTVTVPLGDLTSVQMRILGELAQSYGDGTARVTVEQNLIFRWVRTTDVPDLYRRLAAAGLGLADAGTVADVVSCPGAESCRLAVTQSRGLGKALGDHLRSRPDLVAAAPDLKIKISGCPNGCGQHHIAGLGFQGSVRQLGERAVPQYFVMVGGDAAGDTARYGRLAAKIPGRRLTEAVERLIALYTAERRPGESATEFFGRIDVPRVKALLADLEVLTVEAAAPADYVDLGEDHAFTVDVQEGECSA
jgi:sulfite reductase (NADPH) hemoprotein beta-component